MRLNLGDSEHHTPILNATNIREKAPTRKVIIGKNIAESNVAEKAIIQLIITRFSAFMLNQ
jgi:hypothetical protein